MKTWISLFLLVCLCACGSWNDVQLQDDNAIARDAIIYGADDRHEVAQLPPWLQSIAASNVVVVNVADLTFGADGYYLDLWAYGSFGNYYGLCAEERFADQPVPGYCSGFFVGGPDNNWMATAGHCVDSSSCSSRAFIFNFDASSDGLFAFDDVYFCSDVVDYANNNTNDWAVVGLDRSVSASHSSIPIRIAGSVEDDSAVVALVAVGHPGGMPSKIVLGPEPIGSTGYGGATVTDSFANYFESNLDMYAGNSGSMVVSVDPSGSLVAAEGVLVRGNPDFVYDRDRGCNVSKVCSDVDGCKGRDKGWEEVTRSTQFAHLFAVCGNAVCENGESCDSCPADCGSCAPVCGDGFCDPDESCDSCPDDCGPCACLDAGESCTRNAECCSGSCKGTRGIKVCQ